MEITACLHTDFYTLVYTTCKQGTLVHMYLLRNRQMYICIHECRYTCDINKCMRWTKKLCIRETGHWYSTVSLGEERAYIISKSTWINFGYAMFILCRRNTSLYVPICTLAYCISQINICLSFMCANVHNCNVFADAAVHVCVYKLSICGVCLLMIVSVSLV